MVRVACSTADLLYVQPVREFVDLTHFGDAEREYAGKGMSFADLYTISGQSLADGDVFLGHDFCSIASITTNTPVAEVGASPNLPGGGLQDVSLEFLMDDQDDVLGPFSINSFIDKNGNLRSQPISRWGRFGSWKDTECTFLCRHLDSDATKLMQYQIRESSHGSTQATRYWGGASWSTTASWIDITGSATDAIFLDSVTLDTSYDSIYQIFLRPKTDYASETSHIDYIGLVETADSAEGVLLGYAGAVEFMTAPWPFRIAMDAAANTPVCNICIMRG
jgi:hypothetical protein